MSNYVICTDSGCDIKAEILAEWGVRYKSLTFRFDDSEQEYSNDDMDTLTFYNKMRDGGVAKTAAINTEVFTSLFEEVLTEGKDVLYLGFSSGLSTTYNSARLAANELREKYPDRKILTVDDLVYLKRGGRVSPTAAFFGNMLGIKPVMHVDDEGHLIPVEKVRGRKTSLKAMADQYTQTAKDPTKGVVFISHGDCMKDVNELAGIIRERHGNEVQLVTDVGPVIGAHSGPGTLALFFLAEQR